MTKGVSCLTKFTTLWKDLKIIFGQDCKYKPGSFLSPKARALNNTFPKDYKQRKASCNQGESVSVTQGTDADGAHQMNQYRKRRVQLRLPLIWWAALERVRDFLTVRQDCGMNIVLLVLMLCHAGSGGREGRPRWSWSCRISLSY